MSEWIGKRVRFVKGHHLMSTALLLRLDEYGQVITVSDIRKEALVQFDTFDSHYGRYWIKFNRLEPALEGRE